MNYPETIEFLYGLRLFGTQLGLENSMAIAERFGNPQEKLRFIHVAGTNGKGSTCAFLESVYRTAGYRTGLFTSPHLVSFTERIQVNRQCIAEEDVVRLAGGAIARLGGPDIEKWAVRPTFFEFVTILALLHFAERECELVVWETGLGGRLDATNIVTPAASVITNIHLDHQQWLGSTLAEIAREKAGILKRGVPALTATQEPEALEAIRERARELNAPLTVVDWMENRPLSLPGAHQRRNAALACATVEALQKSWPVPPEAIARALEHTYWPGRLQLAVRGGRRFLLDGAHNPDGALSLANALRADFAGEPVTLILGLFKDKDWREMCEILAPLAARLVLAPVQSDRTADPREVREFCAARTGLEIEIAGSLREVIAGAAGSNLHVIAGSLHLVGEAMELLGLAAGAGAERGLNEWDAARAHSK